MAASTSAKQLHHARKIVPNHSVVITSSSSSVVELLHFTQRWPQSRLWCHLTRILFGSLQARPVRLFLVLPPPTPSSFDSKLPLSHGALCAVVLQAVNCQSALGASSVLHNQGVLSSEALVSLHFHRRPRSISELSFQLCLKAQDCLRSVSTCPSSSSCWSTIFFLLSSMTLATYFTVSPSCFTARACTI